MSVPAAAFSAALVADSAMSVGELSLTLVTVTVIVLVSDPPVAVAVIMTVQVLELSLAPQPGASKFGAEEKVSTPLDEPRVNKSLSVPDFEYVIVSPSASVAV